LSYYLHEVFQLGLVLRTPFEPAGKGANGIEHCLRASICTFSSPSVSCFSRSATALSAISCSLRENSSSRLPKWLPSFWRQSGQTRSAPPCVSSPVYPEFLPLLVVPLQLGRECPDPFVDLGEAETDRSFQPVIRGCGYRPSDISRTIDMSRACIVHVVVENQ